jgi:ABC-type multidrug transport system ATPase subunit
MIRLQDISVELDEKRVLSSINFVWHPGESIALIGANGAGKSTLLKVISSLLKPSSGKIVYPAGMDLQKWRASIGTVFPENFMYESLTAHENLDFYRRLYGIKDNIGIGDVLRKVDLFHVRHEQVRSFSKGMKQRLSIARAMIHQPTYFLLDEPFDGLDHASKEVLKGLLFDLKQKGAAWILVSHDIQEAWALCDRTLVLHQGKLVAEEKCDEETFERFEEDYFSLFKETKHAFS